MRITLNNNTTMLLYTTACVLLRPTSNAPPLVKYPWYDDIDDIIKAKMPDLIIE